MYEKLQATLKNQGISKYGLAKMTGISTQDVYNLINGKRPLYAGWKKRIAEALNMSESELFEDD